MQAVADQSLRSSLNVPKPSSCVCDLNARLFAGIVCGGGLAVASERIPVQNPQLEWQEVGEVEFLTDPAMLADAGILVAFTSRAGGSSPAPFASLNLAFHVGDERKQVLANRRKVCHSLGVDFSRMTCAEQVHGTNVAIVEEYDAGRGHDDYADAIAATDALATQIPGVALAMFFADCVPVVIVDRVRRVIGVAHAGWKGVEGGVVTKLILRMSEEFGTLPADLVAYIGPAIGPCCYEVDAERAALFARRFPEMVRSSDRCIDLGGLTAKSLDEAGVPRQNVAAANVCTAENTGTFYSYRGEGGRTGRHAAIVCIAS